MLFDLVRPGSQGNTLTQLCNVMALCSPERELLWNDTVSALTSEYDGRCLVESFNTGECDAESPTVKVANSIWIDAGAQLQTNYSDVVGEYLLQTDFMSPDAGDIVNDWVNTSTLGLIDSIVDEGSIPYTLLAINSIYLKASWEKPFEERDTNEDVFYKDATRVESLNESAHFMHAIRIVPYSDVQLPGYQIIRLGYFGGLAMVFVLPLDASADSVASGQVIDALPFLEEKWVALALPKFRIESEYKDTLKASLMALGLTSPFVGEGFCGLIQGCQLIDLLVQKTFIEMDEKGTIAAAVTAAGFRSEPDPDATVLFLADHPFQFFIYDETQDLVLFEGRVGTPTISGDWPPAQLQAFHDDPAFWTSNFPELDSPPMQPMQPGTSTTQPPMQSSTSTTQEPVQPITSSVPPSTTTQPPTQPSMSTTQPPIEPSTSQSPVQTTKPSTSTTQPPIQSSSTSSTPPSTTTQPPTETEPSTSTTQSPIHSSPIPTQPSRIDPETSASRESYGGCSRWIVIAPAAATVVGML